MIHEAKQIFVKDESDGLLTVLFRCCGDTSTDQWHSLYIKAETTDQEIQDFLAYAKTSCEQQHGARERARDIVNRGL